MKQVLLYEKEAAPAATRSDPKDANLCRPGTIHSVRRRRRCVKQSAPGGWPARRRRLRLHILDAVGHLGALLFGLATLQLLCAAVTARSAQQLLWATGLGLPCGWTAWQLAVIGERAADALEGRWGYGR